MSRRVTIVMYHFVRNLRHSRYPAIKGRDTLDFVGQLDYISKHYNVIRMEDVIASSADPELEWPERAALLTFDDGYAEHFHTVFPLLDRLGLQGSFFPPARAVLERKVLDVNKIHFLLAVSPDHSRLVEAMEARIEAARGQTGVETVSYYRKTHAQPHRWDSPEVVYMKRMLQRGLPERLRVDIVGDLFHEFVAADETAFADELYVSMEQLRCMHRHGMYIGAHGYEHCWLDSLTPQQQEEEVRKSMDFLRDVGGNVSAWTMCYPYGGYDASLLGILEREGCSIGLTTEVAIADLATSSPLKLARIDTNDLPTSGTAAPNEWTRAAST